MVDEDEDDFPSTTRPNGDCLHNNNGDCLHNNNGSKEKREEHPHVHPNTPDLLLSN